MTDTTTPDPQRMYEAQALCNTQQGYHQFQPEEPGLDPSGSFEVFWSDGEDVPLIEARTPGWYWHACFPGCLPDSDASGPFGTSVQAREDADPNWRIEI